jgi:2-polyprenyl-3-methyl-5-hydroxy-6-metoxy-1,4-benzoquinol methylase
MDLIPQNPEDQVGHDTLQLLSKADRLNHWMYKSILPFCKADVLEIGSGIGNISKFFIQAEMNIMLSDLRTEYCEALAKRYTQHPAVLGVGEIDLVHPQFKEEYQQLLSKFNTVYALNVVEHIENDLQALENCRNLLQKDGNLIILVPAYNSLFCDLDRELGHYRRYTQKSLSQIFEKAGFEIIHKQYFNLAAVGGWFWYGKVLKHQILPAKPLKTYNRLVPVFKVLDRLVLNKVGNSVIVVGKKV